MATLMFEQIKEYSVPIKRAELPENYHEIFLEERRQEYFKHKTKWPADPEEFTDAITEELTVYKPKNITRPENIVTEENAYLFKWLYDKEEEKKYDFKTYMLKKGPLKR